MRILLVDDDLNLLEQLSEILLSQKYEVDTAGDGEAALDKIFDASYDLLLLDIMLPGRDGLTLLKEIREAGIDTPVLMLTAKGSVEDRVTGLDHGADDYLTKPFSATELLARIRALLRRSGTGRDSVMKISNLQLDTSTRKIYINDKEIDLTKKEFLILEFLMYNANRTVSRFDLAEHVWGDDFDPFTMSNFIDVHVKNLRKKIGGEADREIIKTVRGVGFIIERDEK